VNLNGWILRIDLTFDKTLQRPWYPDIKTNLTIDRGDLEAEMLLNARSKTQFLFVTQNTVQAGK
jgi:hypothetical protein